jgi:hypothetical protein
MILCNCAAKSKEGVNVMPERQRVPKVWPDWISLPKVSIRTAQMFGRLSKLFGRFIDFEDSLFYTLSVIYVLLTYLYDIFDEIPYLQVFGLKGSGKTRYGDLLEGLCSNQFSSSEISDASLYRAIGQEYGGTTVIIDEADDLSGSTRRGILLRILRSGYRRNGNVTRCSPDGGIERFSTFCPKIIINEKGIGDSALESRTIPIHMIKSTSSLERFQFSKVENEFKEVKGLISSFSKDHRNLVFNRYASFRGIDGISGRDEEVWAPILIIAETLDAEVGSLFIKESMLALAKKIILQKKRTQLIGNVEAQILEATQVYVDQVEPLAIDGISLYVGADLWRSVKDRCSLPGLKIETVSRVLKRNGIIMDIRRPRLPIKGQKSCYQLDKEKLLKITAEYS